MVNNNLKWNTFNNTIAIPRNQSRKTEECFSMMKKNPLFTDSMDVHPEGTIDLYRKKNAVERCFRNIDTMDVAFPVYHSPRKTRFTYSCPWWHISSFHSYARKIYFKHAYVSLISIKNYLIDLNINYAANGRNAACKMECKSGISKLLD